MDKLLSYSTQRMKQTMLFSELKTKCLIIGSRVVIGGRPSLKEPGNHYPSKYFGHITIDAMKRKHTMDMNNAVSTSHHSQRILLRLKWQWSGGRNKRSGNYVGMQCTRNMQKILLNLRLASRVSKKSRC